MGNGSFYNKNKLVVSRTFPRKYQNNGKRRLVEAPRKLLSVESSFLPVGSNQRFDP